MQIWHCTLSQLDIVKCVATLDARAYMQLRAKRGSQRASIAVLDEAPGVKPILQRVVRGGRVAFQRASRVIYVNVRSLQQYK